MTSVVAHQQGEKPPDPQTNLDLGIYLLYLPTNGFCQSGVSIT